MPVFDASAPSIAETPLQTDASITRQNGWHPSFFHRISQRLETLADAERDQLPLWLPVGLGLGIAAQAVTDGQRLQRQQHRAEVGAGLLRALGHHRDAAVVARQDLQDQAGLAPVVAVQDEGGLVADSLGSQRSNLKSWDGRPAFHSYPKDFTRVSSSAQPERTFTQISRNTLQSMSFSSSWRASVPIRLSRSPFSPITIALCPSRSTMIVAAILTIIGYSMNDTVVVFDRLRENLRKYKTMPLREVIDLSINETLSRTIITGVTAVGTKLSTSFENLKTKMP